MCGIAGIVSPYQIDEPMIQTMCESITHRGPDDSGIEVWHDHGVGLGHRRLSIIDLSPAGHNPMCNEDGQVWIVFNGEIYNFQSLRRELERSGHRFRSNTDTEVILHAYEEWGDEHVHRLRGMFAYALYDRRSYRVNKGRKVEQKFRVMLVRDRPGIKPLFYSWHKGNLLFASEIKALLAYDGIDRDLDRSALFDYFTYRYIPAPKTNYAHIRKLPAGHILTLEDNQTHIHQYWDVPLNRPSPARTIAEAIDMVRATLQESIQLHMVSDVPVGVFLSGGMDSSVITALMSQASTEPLHTFSIGFDIPGRSETDYARLIVQQYHTTHFERIVGEEMLESIPLALQLYDELFADGSWGPTYQVAALAHEHVKVVLSGDGGDEIFAGYAWYEQWYRRCIWQQRFRWVPLLGQLQSTVTGRHTLCRLGSLWPRRWRIRSLFDHLAAGNVNTLEPFASYLEFFSPTEKRRLFHPEWAREFDGYDDYWYFRQYWHDELDVITRLQYLDFKTLLCDDILTKVDRASMAVSLEVRPPLLDHALIELLFSLPSDMRFRSGNLKYLLKQATQDIVPKRIRERPKQGFSAPWATWMEQNPQWLEDVILSGTFSGILRDDIDTMLKNVYTIRQKWALALLSQWGQHQRNLYGTGQVLS